MYALSNYFIWILFSEHPFSFFDIKCMFSHVLEKTMAALLSSSRTSEPSWCKWVTIFIDYAWYCNGNNLSVIIWTGNSHKPLLWTSPVLILTCGTIKISLEIKHKITVSSSYSLFLFPFSSFLFPFPFLPFPFHLSPPQNYLLTNKSP